MKKLSHKQRILKLLEQAGEKGIHSFDLGNRVTPRAAARINDLKNDGYQIEARSEKKGSAYGVRYFLDNDRCACGGIKMDELEVCKDCL